MRLLRNSGFRIILTVINLAFYLTAIFICRLTPSMPARVARIGINAVDALNLPALFIAVGISKVIPMNPSHGILLAVPLLAILWYLIGLWIDRNLGFVHRNPPKRSTVRDLTLVIMCSAAALATVPMLQTLSQERRGGEVCNQIWPSLVVCTWYAFLLICARQNGPFPLLQGA